MPAVEDLAEENRRLRRSVTELSVLAEIAAATAQEQSVQAVVELIVHKTVRALAVEQGAIYLLTDQDSRKPFETLVRDARSSSTQLPFRLGDQIIGWMLQHQRLLEVNDLASDARFKTGEPGSDGIRSLLVAPLRFRARLIGMLIVFNKKTPGDFTEEDRRLLSIIAGHAAPVIRTSQLIGDLRQDRDRLESENSQLWRDVNARFSPSGVLGSSKPIQDLLAMIDRIRDTDVDVLITGESGTGKELFARTVHHTSRRARRPFVALNCAALPESLVEAELLGIEHGVATGVDRRIGQFEAAHKGTLFLDEIGDLPLTAQAKILRVLQERVVQRIGGRESIPVDVRVIAATNKNLEEEIRKGSFREDLFYRLNVIRLHPPALRTIREDIEPIANFFLVEACKQLGRHALTFSPQVLAALRRFDWPGNVRQLQNEVKRAAICSRGPEIEIDDLSPAIREGAGQPLEQDASTGALERAIAEYERKFVEDALASHGGNQSRTAEVLGLSRQGLIKKMKRLGIA